MLREAFGELRGLKLAYVGDGNNVARSLALVGAAAGIELRIAAPDGYQLEPLPGVLETDDPREAVAGAGPTSVQAARVRSIQSRSSPSSACTVASRSSSRGPAFWVLPAERSDSIADSGDSRDSSSSF
ncbi:hypothetical protein B4Q13_23825 [Lacticaseibacillus rhamnosus]